MPRTGAASFGTTADVLQSADAGSGIIRRVVVAPHTIVNGLAAQRGGRRHATAKIGDLAAARARIRQAS